jgi:hypothetical protein
MYGAIAYFLIYRLIARGDVFLTYVFNVVYIILILSLDYAAHKFAERKSDVIKNVVYNEMGAVSRFLFMFTQGSNLTAIYIFYITILILSQVTIFRPDLFPHELGNFFTSLEYGIILLVVFDRLKDLVKLDKIWFLKYLAPNLSEKTNKK